MEKYEERIIRFNKEKVKGLIKDIMENKDEDIELMGMTSFFKVNDNEKLEDIINRIDANVLVAKDMDGEDSIVSILAHDSISFSIPLDVTIEDKEEYEGEMVSTWRLLQEVLPEGEEIISQSLLYSKKQDEVLVEAMKIKKDSISTESKIRKIGSNISYEGIIVPESRANDTVEKLLNAIFSEDDTKYMEMTNFFKVNNEELLDEIIKRIPSQVIVLRNKGKISMLTHDALGDCIPLNIEEDKIENYEGSYDNTFNLIKGIIPDGEVVIINSLAYSKLKDTIEPGFSIITRDKTEII